MSTRKRRPTKSKASLPKVKRRQPPLGNLTLLILSHRRAGKVTTHEAFSGCKLCVPEAQVEDYAQHHERSDIVSHPDSVVGLPAKRQWVLENFADVAMMDDDSTGLIRVYRQPGSRRNSKLPRDVATAVLVQTARTCRALGAYLFGFALHPHPRAYNGLRPFKFGGYSNAGVMGVLGGSKLWFPPTKLPVDDYWICLLNAYWHRYAFYDTRYALTGEGTFVSAGGMGEFRVSGTEREATQFLLRYFGDAVVKKNFPGVLTKKLKSEGLRSIHVPWRH